MTVESENEYFFETEEIEMMFGFCLKQARRAGRIIGTSDQTNPSPEGAAQFQDRQD
jgi:hypothetical protein